MIHGSRVVRCRFCKGRHLLRIPSYIPRYSVRPAVDKAKALNALQTLWRDGSVPAGTRKRMRLQDASLFYAPVYELAAVRIGRFLTDREIPSVLRKHADGGAAFEKDTKVMIAHHTSRSPACRIEGWGLEAIPIDRVFQKESGARIEPFDPVGLQKNATVLDPEVSGSSFEGSVTRTMDTDAHSTRMIEKRISVYYYPAWRMRYRCGYRSYRAVVDAVFGEVLEATAPQGTSARATWFTALSAGAGLLIALSLRLLLGMDGNWDAQAMLRLAAAAACLTAAGAAIRSGWPRIRRAHELRFLRRQGVLEKESVAEDQEKRTP